MNTQEPIRFAVVGCGALARGQHIPNIVASKRAVLQTCCDINDQSLADCRARHAPQKTTRDFKEAIADDAVDAVCLATTEKMRLPVIETAAAHGKPIYVEKPLARSLSEVYRIRDVIRQSGIGFCVGHNRRSSPAMMDAHRIFRGHMDDPKPCPWRFEREGANRPPLEDEGAPAMTVRINDDWHSWQGWVFDKEQAPHGPMLFEMTHFTDICNWFLMAEPMAVTSMAAGHLNHAVSIGYRGGALANITMGANGTMGYPKELFEAMGQGGMLAVDHMVEVRAAGIADAPARRVYPLLRDAHPDSGAEGGLTGWLAKRRAACAEAVKRNDPLLQFTVEPDKGHSAHLNRFIDQILGEGPEVCGIDDAVLATEVAFAAVISARERRTVSLEELRQCGDV